MKKLLSLFTVLLSLAACKNTPNATIADIQGIDTSIKPGNNFFMYVNRTWYDSAQIPPSQSGVGAYMFMNYPQRLRLQGILDSVAKANNTAGSIEQKLGDFYASGLDTITINQRGYEPISPLLARIDSIGDVASLMKFAATEAKASNTSFIAFGVGADNKNSSLNIAHIYQTGLRLLKLHLLPKSSLKLPHRHRYFLYHTTPKPIFLSHFRQVFPQSHGRRRGRHFPSTIMTEYHIFRWSNSQPHAFLRLSGLFA